MIFSSNYSLLNTTTGIENIIDRFLYKTVTLIIGQPAYENISEMNL